MMVAPKAGALARLSAERRIEFRFIMAIFETPCASNKQGCAARRPLSRGLARGAGRALRGRIMQFGSAGTKLRRKYNHPTDNFHGVLAWPKVALQLPVSEQGAQTAVEIVYWVSVTANDGTISGVAEQMTKFMRSAASLCLASPVILACCGRAVCDEKALPPAESAGGGIMPAPGK